jgi:phosphoribosylformylglycinamidine cyclo-ligase
MAECYDARMANAPIDYQSAGVDYHRIDALKVRAQQAARGTARHLAGHGAREIESSRGESAYVFESHGVLLASIVECLGTKSLVADAMRAITGRSHYDTIAQDTIAMAVNDLVSVGAAPVSLHAYWAAGSSDWFSDVPRMEDLVRGWQAACDSCEVSWGGGETPALAGVVAPTSIDLAASCVGIVPSRAHLTLGDNLHAGDVIVLLESSGIHANGVSLVRKLVEGLPRGYATPLPDGRPFGEAVLDPTVLYPPVLKALWAANIVPHYCVNITGHGWRKLMRHAAQFTYRLHGIPAVPEVLSFMQREGRMDAREAYGSLNMGAGFALFVPQAAAAATIVAARSTGLAAWECGVVEPGPRRVIIEPLGIEFAADELALRG